MHVRQTLDFLIHDWLRVGALCQRGRFAEHGGETFAAVLDTAEKIARSRFAPFNRLVDTEEPRTEMGEDGALRVVLPQATAEAFAAYAESGMLAAAQDEALGGMQLPYTVEAAANAIFSMASVSIGWSLLTVGNANLLLAHGTPRQREVFARHELDGRWAGTMCLSEPQAGSSLSDIAMRALPEDEGDPLGPRYRLFGNKMWISGGEHDITENIVHLVLAKIPDANGRPTPGTRGISLFIVPKRMVDAEGALTGERNDVTLAGLNHKCGWRGTPNTLLNFGEGAFRPGGVAGAVGYRVGAVGQGLACMFHMMNEARIGIGLAATMLGMAGYQASLDYAKQRLQGRALGATGKDAAQGPIAIIEHADVKRMLLAQKAYCEGALALALYGARLVDDARTGEPAAAEEAKRVLEVLTPIIKSWPSEWCLEANSLAIQIHGGYGYTRDFPVEQYWRDNRLNMIHEGTHGIQALDLLGRKVVQDGGRDFRLLATRIEASIARAEAAPDGELREHADALRSALARLSDATRLAWSGGTAAEALANATPYLQAFGHVVLAWIWLDVVLALPPSNAPAASPFHEGKRAACRYFYRYELPKIDAWLGVVGRRDSTCSSVPVEAF
ncbi:MAG: acyl-CoA dehydrogenase C-terminal domain-containing protein [Proteobacteria bacterium]|nr:acyl-CoA dehydrogenase C-terminal domain-containing protein [Pseudomonadota bacterium]